MPRLRHFWAAGRRLTTPRRSWARSPTLDLLRSCLLELPIIRGNDDRPTDLQRRRERGLGPPWLRSCWTSRTSIPFRLPHSWDGVRQRCRRSAGWESGSASRPWPGTQLQRYTISYTDPFLNDKPNSLGLSAYDFDPAFTESIQLHVVADNHAPAATRSRDWLVSFVILGEKRVHQQPNRPEHGGPRHSRTQPGPGKQLAPRLQLPPDPRHPRQPIPGHGRQLLDRGSIEEVVGGVPVSPCRLDSASISCSTSGPTARAGTC